MYPIKTRTKYNQDALGASMNTYTTVYLGNYVSGDIDEDVGSHPGVDIVPMTPNDTVYAVLPGVVHFSGANASNGEYIVIQHNGVPSPTDMSKTTTLYSIYLHLSSRSVVTGEGVKEGSVIGKTGSTGQSTGEHLHFQIDTASAPFHPYWPFTLSDANALGLGFFEAVNRGLGIDSARKFTVNPLVYLDKVEKNGGVHTVVTPAKEEIKIAATVIDTKPVTPVATASFSDVPTNSAYFTAVEYLKSHNIASGANGKFRPDAGVTRAELLKMAFIASGRTLSADIVPHFSDVELDSPFIAYINTAREMGAVSGFPDGTFRPDAGVTRAEALKIVLSILSVSLGVTTSPYSDVAISDWVAKYASWAKSHGVFTGSFLQPDMPMKRGEVANLIYQAKK